MNRTLLLLGSFLFVSTSFAQQPDISYTGSLSICAGQSKLLTVDGAAAGATFKWRKDGTAIDPAQTQSSYFATSTGTFDVIVITGAVSDTLDPVKVTVNPKPVSAFTFSGSNQCSNIPVSFNNASNGTGLGYTWNFGDANSKALNSSDDRNPLHTFIGGPGNATQSFTVRLIVADNKGCSDTATRAITVMQVPGTQLGGTGATTYNELPYFTQCNAVASSFDFTNQSSTKTTNTSYQIKWGDASGDFSTTDFNATSHTYNVGTSQLQLIVQGDNGCKDTAVYNVFVGSNPAVGLGNPGNTIICSGTSLTFPISSTSSNPPGTVYTVTFNDGTAPIVYNHPAPASVTHRFDEGSCGITSGSFSNSFSATIVASNPCGVSAASVVPIYVSKKAQADFSISPNDTACVNSTVTFTNTGINANSVSALGQCTPGKSVWKITPATGWNISSGTLGDDFGLNDPSTWAAGSTVLGVNFILPGIYKIKLKTGGTSLCGDDEIEKTICVNPLPVAAFTTSVAAGCLPLTVTTTNTSNVPNCGTNVYNWSVSYSNSSGCTPGTADYDYINGTSSRSATPQFKFNNPGVYTISLYLSNISSACVSAVVTKQITVRARPSLTLSTVSSICSGNAVNPVATVYNCYGSNDASYAWTFGGGLPGVSTAANPGAIVYNTAGTYNLALSVTNECGSATATKQVTVKPSPDVNMPSNKIYCAGQTAGALTFSSSSPGAILSWTNSNPAIGLGSSGSGNIPSFTTMNPGTAAIVSTIQVKALLNGCEGAARTFTITVNPRPAAPVVNSPVNYCMGETGVALQATATSGYTLQWYTVATGGTGSSAAPTPLTNAPGSVSYYVSQLNPVTGCESARTLIVVNVKPAPKITGSSSSNPSTCASSTGFITLQGLTANTGFTVKYNKNGVPVTVPLSSNGSGVLVIQGLTAGTYSNLSVHLNGCASNEVGPFTLVDPDPPGSPTVGSDGPVCFGAPLHLSSSTSSTGTVTYSWTGPNNFTSNVQYPTITAATLVAAGDYTVTITRNGCSVSKTATVIVNPQPTKPVVERPVFYCLNETALPLKATASAGNTLAWYDNKELVNGTVSAPTPSTRSAGTFVYYITQTNSQGCVSDTSVIEVTVYSLVTGNAIGSDQTVCSGGTAADLTTVTASAGGNGIYQYQWQVSTDNGANWTDIAGATIESYMPGVIVATSKFRRIATSASCDGKVSNVVTITVQGSLSNYDIASSQSICAGEQPSVLNGQMPVGGSGSYTFEWESSTDKNNWTKIGGAGLQNYQPPALSVTTHYRRKVTSGSCSAHSSIATITVNAKPVMNAVANFTYCSGSTGGNIAFGSVPSANIVYSWVNDNPSIGLAASGTGNLPAFTTTNDLVVDGLRSSITAHITVTPAFDDGTIHCAGDPFQFTITILPFITPRQPSDIPVCSGITIPLYTPVSGARDYAGSTVTYNWSVNGNSINLTNGSGMQVPAFTTTNNGNTDAISVITITATYILNGVSCEGGSISYDIIVKPSITNNSISADQNICVKTAAALLQGSVPAGGNGGYKYQWQSSTDGVTWNDLAGAHDIHYDPGVLLQTTKFRRNVNTSMCSASASSNVVTINVGADAKALFASAKDTGCAPFVLDASVFAVQQFPQNTVYNWYANGNFIGVGANFPGYTIDKAHDSVLIKLVAISGCKPDSIEHEFFTHRVPVPSFTLSDESGCGPLTVAISNTTPDPALFSYSWDFGNGVTSTAMQPHHVVFAPNPTYGDTMYTVELTANSVCDLKGFSKTVLVKSRPKAMFAPGKTVGCSPMTVVFNNTSAGVGNKYEWDFGDGAKFVSDNTEPVTHVFTTAVRDTFYVKLRASNECGEDSLQYAIVVSPNTIKLDFAVNGDEETGCAPHVTRFINNSRGASSFTWDFGDGTIVNTSKNIDTVSHSFILPGTYTIMLRATNGCSDTTSTETVIVYPSPLAAFDFAAGCLNDPVRFNNMTSTATSYQWGFGDGLVSTEKNPSHVFAEPGQYIVTLKAFQFNAPGSICSDTVTKLINLGPSGTFSYNASLLCNDGRAVFQVQSNNTDTVIFRFGDGEQVTTTGNTVTHAYDNAGIYLPSVILKNKAGCELLLTGNDSIKVDKVKSGFHAVQQRLCGKTIVNFTDTSFAYFGKISVHWNFGDGTTGAGSNVEHSFTAAGTYPIELIVTGSSGCADTVRQQIAIAVNDLPVASIDVDAISCVGYSMPFRSTVQSVDAVNLLHWSLSNGVSSDQASFHTVFNQPGQYSVRFITGTVNGCYDTATQNIRINPSPVVTTGNDQTICLGNTTGLNATGSDQLTWSPLEGLSCVDCPGPLAAPLVTTPYVVKGTNSFGCSAYDTVVVTVIQPLQMNVSADDSICTGSSTNLLASGASSYNWSPALGLSSPTVSNPVAAPVTTTRYRVVGYDGHHCFTDTAYVLVGVGQYPKINLGPDLVLAAGTLQPLTSVVDNGPVKTWNWTPTRDLSCSDCPLPTATIKKDISYIVDITNFYGCSAKDSINIKVFCENSQVFIANAFTPDGDGVNDVLLVQGKGIAQVKSWRIFNRWGELVFERSNFAANDLAYGWDGKVRGVAGGPDVFVFTAEVICENGTPYNYKGNVSIIK